MQENQFENRIEELLPYYFEGNVTDEERQLVEAWINATEDNKKIAKQFFSIYLATDTLRVLKQVDTEKALENVSSKIMSKRVGVWLRYAQRVAAILFIPLLITILVQKSSVNRAGMVSQMIEIKTNPGMTTSFMLPDSTVVYLNSESSLSYPATFDGNKRNVSLIGEAYFEVSRNPSKPFIVSTIHNSRIEVLGTHFNVEAYASDENVTTTLVEGKVNFLFRQNEKLHKVPLKPGEKIIYTPQKAKVDLLTTSCESETSWKDGKIILNNTSLQNALRMLEKRYHIEFIVKNKKALTDKFTGVFTNERLEHILNHFKISSKVQWRYIEQINSMDKKSKIEIY